MPEDPNAAGSTPPAGKKKDEATVPAAQVSPTNPPSAPEGGEAAPAKSGGRLIKYMGSADVRILERNDDAGGTLPPLPFPIRFKRSNNWTVDTAKLPEVDSVWWDHLTEHDNFKDVTDYKVKPLNAHQTTFLGMSGTPAYNADLDALSSDAPA